MSKPNAPQTTSIADEIRDFITRYVALPDETYADILSLYVLHTHAFDAFRVTPYIYINSAERGSGKTLLLEILQTLCRNGEMAANLTSSGVFRVIEATRPTFLVDEVDAIWSGSKNEDLRGVLNSGYKSTGSVLRAFGNPNDEDGGVKRFSTYCPKVLAGIDNGLVPDTIMDRSIVLTLRRANADQMAALDEFYAEDIEDDVADLLEKIDAWVAANRDALSDRENRPARIDGIGPRQNEIARPLLTIAARVGWYDRAKSALHHLLASDEMKLSPQANALFQVREWFVRNPNADRILSSTVAEITGANGKQLSIWFNAYGIKPFTGTFDGKNAKGYRKADFADAWERYLPML